MANPTERIEGKMFIGGLSLNTTQESLRKYFENYGKVSDCVLMIDKITNRSRGFGFVTMANSEAVQIILKEKNHILDGKTIDCKEAVPKDASPMNEQSARNDFATKKIFVGGLPHNLTDQDFKGYFEQYGKVIDCIIMRDKESQRTRGFGFVTYDSEDVVDQVVAQYKDHYLLGKWVDVKKATPKSSNPGKSTPYKSPNNAFSPNYFNNDMPMNNYNNQNYMQSKNFQNPQYQKTFNYMPPMQNSGNMYPSQQYSQQNMGPYYLQNQHLQGMNPNNHPGPNMNNYSPPNEPPQQPGFMRSYMNERNIRPNMMGHYSNSGINPIENQLINMGQYSIPQHQINDYNMNAHEPQLPNPPYSGLGIGNNNSNQLGNDMMNSFHYNSAPNSQPPISNLGKDYQSNTSMHQINSGIGGGINNVSTSANIPTSGAYPLGQISNMGISNINQSPEGGSPTAQYSQVHGQFSQPLHIEPTMHQPIQGQNSNYFLNDQYHGLSGMRNFNTSSPVNRDPIFQSATRIDTNASVHKIVSVNNLSQMGSLGGGSISSIASMNNLSNLVNTSSQPQPVSYYQSTPSGYEASGIQSYLPYDKLGNGSDKNVAGALINTQAQLGTSEGLSHPLNEISNRSLQMHQPAENTPLLSSSTTPIDNTVDISVSQNLQSSSTIIDSLLGHPQPKVNLGSEDPLLSNLGALANPPLMKGIEDTSSSIHKISDNRDQDREKEVGVGFRKEKDYYKRQDRTYKPY